MIIGLFLHKNLI